MPQLSRPAATAVAACASRRRVLTLAASGAALVAVLSGCNCGNPGGSGNGIGDNVAAIQPVPPGSLRVDADTYNRMVGAFYTGVVAMNVGATNNVKQIAIDQLLAATKTVPQEAAAWANLGLAYQRMGTTADAAPAAAAAAARAPGSTDVQRLFGLVEWRQNQWDEALKHLREAVRLEPANVRARWGIVKVLTDEGAQDAGTEMAQQLDGILRVSPRNVAALIERTIVAARNGDAASLKDSVDQLSTQQDVFTGEARQGLESLRSRSGAADIKSLVGPATILRNLCIAVPAYRRDLETLNPDAPIDRFIGLPSVPSTPAAPDTATAFAAQAVIGAPQSAAPGWTVAEEVILQPELPQDIAQEFKPHLDKVVEKPPSVLLCDGRDVVILPAGGGTPLKLANAFPGPIASGRPWVGPTADNIAVMDFNYDFRPDLVLAGPGGIRFFQQDQKGGFADVTVKTGLPSNVLHGSYTGAWPVDIDLDGDLDVILAAPSGPPTVLRNNGDGTWKPIHPFAGVSGLRQFVCADLRGGGAGDISMLDGSGQLVAFGNDYGGQYRRWTTPTDLGPLAAITAADVTRRGAMDLIALRPSGSIVRLARPEDADRWDQSELTTWTGAPTDGTARLMWADLDNNGGLDLVATGSRGTAVWLSDRQGALHPLGTQPNLTRATLAQTNSTGRIDLIGIGPGSAVQRAANTGSTRYRWQDVRPRARFVVRGSKGTCLGDDRINSFGIGGDIEIRAGLLYQRERITGPTLHFGLGENDRVNAIRIMWPNGCPRAEFPDSSNNQLAADQMVTAPYRLGGSCPWLFVWNGHNMQLVTDCIWRSPLGLRINGQDTAGATQTEDWVKIRGDQLAPRDGYYDVRITAELWETHYFDRLALMAVDHPANTDVYVDERFAFPQPPLAVVPTSPVKPVVRAVDDNGTDVTDIVRARDGRYLDTFGRGQYQGVTRDHYVEVEIGPDAPRTGPLWLVATGWIHPTDSSVNVAIGQSHFPQPTGLSLEVPDGHGRWAVARKNLGFPEGKVKTVLLDLNGIFRPGTPRRVRLRTNLEIYWDFLGYAAGSPATPLRKTFAPLDMAQLRYRGFSDVHTANISSPELPDYGHVARGPRWLDLEGYYTRYGDVKPLVTQVDDRYVIMNAGDELALRFKALPPPAPGWTRDYVLIGNGWEKDGNYNTQWCRTVRPLPSRDQKLYPHVPATLQDDPVYKRHPEDWQTYHTRYVDPSPFLDAMKPREAVQAPANAANQEGSAR